SGAPSTADAHPNRGIGLDVTDVVRMLAVLGNHPESVVDHAAADGRPARLTALAAGGFEDDPRHLAAYRVHQQSLDAMDHLPFEVPNVGHSLRFCRISGERDAKPQRKMWSSRPLPRGRLPHSGF